MSIINKIRDISLFKSLKDNEELLSKIAEIIVVKSFSRDTYIIKEGEIGNSMYILIKGTVSIEKTTSMGDVFSVAKLSETNNVYFGEPALMDNDVRSASVITITDTVCYMINKDTFDNFCEDNPMIGYLIIKDIAISLANKLRKTTNDNLVLINALCCDE